MSGANTAIGPGKHSALVILLIVASCSFSWSSEPHELTGHADAVYDIEFSPDGRLLASGSYDNTVKLWNLHDRDLLSTLSGHHDQVFRVDFSHNGASLASASGDGTTIIWDLANRKIREILAGKDHAVIDVRFSPDGRFVVTAGTHVRFWDATKGVQIWSIPQSDTYFSVAFSPDQKTLALGTHNLVRLCDVANGVILADITTKNGMVYQLEFSVDGKMLAAANSDGSLSLWDASRRKELNSVIADQNALFSAAFSPNGRHIATGGRDRTVRIWTVAELKRVRELSGPEETILAVTYSPNGQSIATGSYDGKIHLWHLDTQPHGQR